MKKSKSNRIGTMLDEYYNYKKKQDEIKEQMDTLRETIFALMAEPIPDTKIEVIASGLTEQIEAIKYLKKNTVINKKKVIKVLGEDKFRKLAKITLTDLKKEVSLKEFNNLIKTVWETEPSFMIRKIEKKEKKISKDWK